MSGDSSFEWWRRTLQYKTGLGLTEDEKIKYEKDLSVRTTKNDCERCYSYRDWMLQYSPSVRFMIEQIDKVKPGAFKPEQMICEECEGYEKAGGFHPELGIMLCQNRILDKYHLEDTMTHELVHYYDNLRFKVDWLNLKHHACSEIRASSLSGECRLMLQFWYRAINKVGKGHQECVKRRAIISLQLNPNCESKEHATKIVDEVFESCFNDTRPFEEIYK